MHGLIHAEKPDTLHAKDGHGESGFLCPYVIEQEIVAKLVYLQPPRFKNPQEGADYYMRKAEQYEAELKRCGCDPELNYNPNCWK